jgi:MSHA biogenesis protein MshK
LLLLLAAGATAAAPPAGLADPTRPPGAVAAPAAAASATPPKATAAPPRLQSVQLGRTGEATALVDGRLLRVGDAIGEAKVVAIDLHGLQLQGPRGRERLWLLAALGRQRSSTPSPPPTPAPPTVAVAGDR